MRPLFIHIPKCGGMTIRHGFRKRVATARQFLPAYYREAINEAMRARGEPTPGYEHARIRDCVDPPPRRFALVRNPWARVASRFMFGRQIIAAGKQPPTYCADTLEGFVQERLRWGGEPYYWHRAVRGWYQAVDYVTDSDGGLVCDVLRTEHLDDDVEAYLGRRPPRPRNVTEQRYDYRSMYDDHTRQAVADWYSDDIDMFGFEFDSPATRNVWSA